MSAHVCRHGLAHIEVEWSVGKERFLLKAKSETGMNAVYFNYNSNAFESP